MSEAMAWSPLAKTVKRLRRRRDGIASVEFAIILPVLVILLFGTIEFGRLLVDYQLVNKSARDAIRYLSRVRDTAITDSCPGGAVLWPDPAPSPSVSNAVNLAMTGSIDGSGAYLLGYWVDASTIEIRVPPCNNNEAGTFSGVFQDSDYIPELTMTVDVSFPSGFGWLLPFLDDFSITVTHNEVHIGD
jgi:hypothetical protein